MTALYLCLVEQHDLRLVLLAGLICTLGVTASYALAQESGRSRDRRTRATWAFGSVLALTSAIWATHFIAMLAYQPGLPFRFDVVRTIASFVVAFVMIGASAAVLLSGRAPKRRLVAGLVAGLGISAMHYTGMSAFEIQGQLHWHAPTVALSVAAGAVLGALAFVNLGARTHARRIGSQLTFVAAVGLDHFLGMTALRVAYDPTLPAPGGIVNEPLLVVLVSGVALLVLALLAAALWLELRDRRQLADEEARLREVADIAVEGLLICAGETVVGANRSLARMLDCRRADLVGRRLADLVEDLRIDDVPADEERDAQLTWAGERIPVRIIGQSIAIGGKPHTVVAVRDQRERLRRERQMLRLAHNDALTGLPNRLSFNEALAATFLLPAAVDEHFALMMCDLDRFKSVNDTLGHATGDELLRRVAGRLAKAVGERDLVARLGGDEFAIIVRFGADLTPVRRLAEDVVDMLGRPYLIDGQVIELSTSVGIALTPSDGRDADSLSRNADLALYRAKEDGRNMFRFFEAEMNHKAQARRQLELDLRRAAVRQEFEVYYQPQVDPATGVFDGAEALVRWRHPVRGLVSPAEFLPLAEEIGLIGTIGEWVLRTACAEATRWPDNLTVAVNLSPVQFRDARLAATVRGILQETGLPGGRLELEVTETALLQDDGSTLATLDELRTLGVRISMDDFGTGYSSLSYLRRFPFDKIKIDQSFIRNLPTDPDSIAIVQAIVSLGAKLRMTVTAEGVETEEQRTLMVAEGCDQIQGYLISRPVPADQIRTMFDRPSPARAVA